LKYRGPAVPVRDNSTHEQLPGNPVAWILLYPGVAPEGFMGASRRGPPVSSHNPPGHNLPGIRDSDGHEKSASGRITGNLLQRQIRVRRGTAARDGALRALPAPSARPPSRLPGRSATAAAPRAHAAPPQSASPCDREGIQSPERVGQRFRSISFPRRAGVRGRRPVPRGDRWIIAYSFGVRQAES